MDRIRQEPSEYDGTCRLRPMRSKRGFCSERERSFDFAVPLSSTCREWPSTPASERLEVLSIASCQSQISPLVLQRNYPVMGTSMCQGCPFRTQMKIDIPRLSFDRLDSCFRRTIVATHSDPLNHLGIFDDLGVPMEKVRRN